MQIYCRKCRRTFDPAVKMAHCSPYFGHADVKPSGQILPDGLLQKKEIVKRPSQFQSDFRLIWDEPSR